MSEISRRDFLKIVIPGAWTLELRKAGGVGNLSTPAKIGLVKDVVLLVGVGGVVNLLLTEKQPKSFKERILSFKWEQANGKELEGFYSDLADEYLRLTKTGRVTKNDLVGAGKTNFLKSREEMVKAIRDLVPDFTPTPTQWGYADFKTGKVFIDLATLKEQTEAQARNNNLDSNKTAGMALLGAVWHEWGHVDIRERMQGELINNPRYVFHSPASGKDEQFRKYRGAEVFTDTYYGFLRFEEVLNETVTIRRIIEQVGLEAAFSAADYYQNGIDFFPMFTSATGIKLDDLYQMHATSDFEGIIKLIGSKLPGDGSSFEKGIKLALGIHQSNPQLIQQSGVYGFVPRGR